jgi:WD40 repeat protein
MRSIVCCFAMILLLGCGGKDKPSASWQLATQGFYTGAISDNGDLAVVGSLNHGASMWRVLDHERLFNWSHQSGEYVNLVAADFSPDGSRAVTTDPRTIVLWDTSSGRALNYWATPSAVLDVQLLSDNRHALLGLEDHSAIVFDVQTGAYESTFLHEGVVGAVAVDQQGEYAVTGSDDNTAVLWALNTGALVHTFQHDNPVRSVAISPQATYTFTAAQGDLVAIWHNSSGTLLHTLHNGRNHGAITARFSPDERLLAVGYTNRKVALYDVSTGQLLQKWDPGLRHPMRASGAAILELAFAENYSTLYALAGDGRLIQLRRS